MIPIKIECACGQRYAFDVEPVEGRVPSPVACPTCGVDGTAAANAVIAGTLSVPAATQRTPGSLRVAAAPVAAAPHASTRFTSVPGQMDRAQAEHEARAKIMWGDPEEEVVKFLMIQGFRYDEAAEMVRTIFQERARTIRASGIGKIIKGSLLVCVPFVAWAIFAGVGVIPLKLLAVAVMVGLWGAWMVLKGTIMFFAPKSEPGDVAEH